MHIRAGVDLKPGSPTTQIGVTGGRLSVGATAFSTTVEGGEKFSGQGLPDALASDAEGGPVERFSPVLDGVARRVVLEGGLGLAPIFERLAEGEVKGHPLRQRQPVASQSVPHLGDFAVAETVGIEVGKAPEGFA